MDVTKNKVPSHKAVKVNWEGNIYMHTNKYKSRKGHRERISNLFPPELGSSLIAQSHHL